MTALVLLFAFTASAVIVLARDYDDRIATRSLAQNIAFQSARVGAQQVEVEALRRDGIVRLDVAAARERATAAADRLLAEHDESGTVQVTIDGARVTVVIEIVDVIDDGFEGSRRALVRAEGSARAVAG